MSIRHSGGDVRKTTERMRLEFKAEVCPGNMYWGVISILILFKSLKLEEFTKGMNVSREERKPWSMPMLRAQEEEKEPSKETENEEQVGWEGSLGP